MDIAKCEALKAELAVQTGPQTVSIDRFFDGNDDIGSIGCNLADHPGVDAFRDIFTSLLRRPDVEAIYAQISELDPGEGCWPFTDTVLVVGTIPADELRSVVSTLEPDDVGLAGDCDLSPSIASKHQQPVLVLWWD